MLSGEPRSDKYMFVLYVNHSSWIQKERPTKTLTKLHALPTNHSLLPCMITQRWIIYWIPLTHCGNFNHSKCQNCNQWFMKLLGLSTFLSVLSIRAVVSTVSVNYSTGFRCISNAQGIQKCLNIYKFPSRYVGLGFEVWYLLILHSSNGLQGAAVHMLPIKPGTTGRIPIRFLINVLSLYTCVHKTRDQRLHVPYEGRSNHVLSVLLKGSGHYW